MSPRNFTDILTQAVDGLTKTELFGVLFHKHADGTPLPSARKLSEIIELTRAVVFPGYFGNTSTVNNRTLKYHIGVNVEKLFDLLTGQVLAGLCFGNDGEDCCYCTECQREEAAEIAAKFISRLPELRRLLATDVEAAYVGDPAAHSFGEVISCYPAIRAISNYRMAHELLVLGVPLIPRIITEMAHSETGIDIHPGAKIGSHFTIDHGTGVVIGETCIIGNHVKLYQGVTLGARSFELDENGKPIKGVPRHPILGNNVIIYSNATILGRISIGDDAIVGGNIWVTEDVPAGGRIVQTKAQK
jgi:serine O-acetyltransferase